MLLCQSTPIPLKLSFLGKFCPKIKNASYMQNFFFFLRLEIFFFGKVGLKNQNSQLKLKFGIHSVYFEYICTIQW